MIGETNFSPNSPFAIPDEYNYMNSFRFNPLFSLNLQFLKYLKISDLLLCFLSQLISALSCLWIYDLSKKYFKQNKICLIFLGGHPVLSLFALKFCTENFGLLGLAYYLSNTFSERDRYLGNKDKIVKRLKYNAIQFIFTLYRAQLLPLAIFQIFENISIFYKRISKKLSRKENLMIICFSFIGLLILSLLIYSFNQSYIKEFLNIENSHYPFSFFKIKNYFFSNSNYSISISNLFAYVVTFLLYLPLAIISLTGARGRLVDLPWRIPFGEFNLINNQTITKLPEDLLINFDYARFIVIAIIPLILLSTFHLIGYYFWIKNTRRISWKLSFLPLSLCIFPLIYFPCLRYFICLIPLSSIGFADSMNKLLKKNKIIKLFE